MKTTDRAQGKWFGILSALGIEHRHLTGNHGPCPLCNAGKDRFRWDNKENRGTYYCSSCGAGDGMKLAMQYTGLQFKECAERIDELCGEVKAQPNKPKVIPMDRLRRISSGLVSITEGDPVATYLKGRNLKCPVKYLRLHPSLPYWDGKELVGNFPAMVAAYRCPEGRVSTFHVTYLTKDGRKAEVPAQKKVTSSMAKGGAIHLCDAAEVMGIAEGIETAIAARILHGVPTWAAVNATALANFEPPETCKKLIVFGDRDASFTGQMYAYQLAHRLRDRVEVVVELPEKIGDFADEVTMNAG
jgi:putative DNA primase/helicase